MCITSIIVVSNKFGWHTKLVDATDSIFHSYIYIVRFYIISIFTNYDRKSGFKSTICSRGDSISQFHGKFHINSSSVRIGEPFNPFFRKPKPVITVTDYQWSRDSGFQRISVSGTPVQVFAKNSTELWINVRNEGKTSIKRMRWN